MTNWKKRAAGLLLATAMFGGASVVAAAPASAASCSAMAEGRLSASTWEFVASCSGGAAVYSSVNCFVGADKAKVVEFPSGGQSIRWTLSCSGGALSGDMQLLNP